MIGGPAVASGLLTLLAVALSLASCRTESRDRVRTSVRDSAGVSIVENRDAGWAASPWRVESEPQLRIGNEGATESYRFSGIRAAFRLSDGGYAVADASSEIRIFDAAGAYVTSIGREGEGPGEFRSISLLREHGPDSLVVWDFPLRRVTVIAVADGGARVSRSPVLAGFFFAEDAFADGSLLGLMSHGVDMAATAPGLLEEPAIFVRYDISSEVIDTIAQCPGGASSYLRSDGVVFSLPFSPSPLAVAAPHQVHCGSGAIFEVETYDTSGALRRIVRLDRPNPPLEDEVVRRFVERLASRQRTPEARERIRADYSGLPYPVTLPAFSALLVDADTNLWVADYKLGDSLPTRWTVFDPRGHIRGALELPGNFEPYEIGPDYLVGVATDSLGVEQAHVLSLRKGP